MIIHSFWHKADNYCICNLFLQIAINRIFHTDFITSKMFLHNTTRGVIPGTRDGGHIAI